MTEGELQAWVDGQLGPESHARVAAWLAGHPDQLQRLEAYRAQRQALRAMFDPVLGEAVPRRLQRAAGPPRPAAWRMAAAVLIALAGGASGWALRGQAGPGTQAPQLVAGKDADFATRAAVAHAVYTPEQRRPVEVDAAHEEQLVAWLSKRLGTPLKPPHLQALGWELEGGRLLPGGSGPVAQFMYRRIGTGGTGGSNAGAPRLTLYVTNELPPGGAAGSSEAHTDPAFRFRQQSGVGTFYWVDGAFGYALSADLLRRGELAAVAEAVYHQQN